MAGSALCRPLCLGAWSRSEPPGALRAARRAQSRQARPEEAQELTSGTPKAGTLNMLPRLDVAIPRAEEQLTAVQHLLILGCWLTQRPRRAARHHSRHAHVGFSARCHSDARAVCSSSLALLLALAEAWERDLAPLVNERTNERKFGRRRHKSHDLRRHLGAPKARSSRTQVARTT